ncbi:MAG: Hint domain-containing protein, partial [Ruminococcus sp.]|nr:Hint domain-containing protein [Ruminococcus sp.]
MACFIAGTMVLTTAGLVAIEKIKAGDIVISTNPDTLETAGKTVLETYVRQVDKLVHLTINGEEIV